MRPSSLPPETTEVLYGNDNIQMRVLETFSWVKEELDGCVEFTEIAVNVKIDAIWNGFVELKKKGVILKSITEITPDNISLKKNMELFETRHLTGLKSNFSIVDRKSCLHSVSHENQPLSHAIITNAKALVEAHASYLILFGIMQFLLEKIREIEEGVKPPFTETLRDPHQRQKLVFDLVNSAKQEILMLLFPNIAIGDIFLEGYNKNVYKKQYSY